MKLQSLDRAEPFVTRRHVRPGDAVLIPAGAWHVLENEGTSGLRILLLLRAALRPRGHVLRVTRDIRV
jgi:mannose-6-phosphate isomerase-like protein (cupin superfamily)